MLGRFYYPYFTSGYKSSSDFEAYIQVRCRKKTCFYTALKNWFVSFVVKYTLLGPTEMVPLLNRQLLKILPFTRLLYHQGRRRRYPEPAWPIERPLLWLETLTGITGVPSPASHVFLLYFKYLGFLKSYCPSLVLNQAGEWRQASQNGVGWVLRVEKLS